jgi:hypothetical protein
LSSRSPPARLWPQLARRKPTGGRAQLPAAFEQGLGLIKVDNSLMLRATSVKEILTNGDGCFTVPIRTTGEMVQKAQLQEEQ